MLVSPVRVGRKLVFMAIYVPSGHSRAIISYRGQFYKGKFQYLRNFMPMSKSLKALMKFFYCQVFTEERRLLLFLIDIMLLIFISTKINEIILPNSKLGIKLYFELLIWCFIFLFLDKTTYKK